MPFLPVLVTPPSSLQRLSGPARAVRQMAHLVRALRAALGAAVNRRDVTRMLDLDDRMLRDIGLTRNDVLGALGARLPQDPSVLLRRRFAENRARQRAFEAKRAPLSVIHGSSER